MLNDDEIAALALGESLNADRGQAGDSSARPRRSFSSRSVFPGTWRAGRRRERLAAARRRCSANEEKLERTFPTVMVMAERPQRRDTFLLIRGAYDKPGDKVEPGVPAVFRRCPQARRITGWGLRKWLIDPGKSAAGARDRESLLADVFRHGHREDGRRFRLAGRVAVASGTAGLAGDGVHPHRLGREGDAEADRHQRDLPAVLARPRRNCCSAIRRTGCWRAVRGSVCPPRWFAIRRCASPGLLVEKLGGPSVKPYQPAGLWKEIAMQDMDYVQEHRRGSLPAQPVHVLEAHLAPPMMVNFDAAHARELRGARDPHQYAAAGAESDERCDVPRSGALARAAHDEGRRVAPPTRACATVSGWCWAARPSPKERRSCATTCSYHLDYFATQPRTKSTSF